jgi:hypothetical protein
MEIFFVNLTENSIEKFAQIPHPSKIQNPHFPIF